MIWQSLGYLRIGYLWSSSKPKIDRPPSAMHLNKFRPEDDGFVLYDNPKTSSFKRLGIVMLIFATYTAGAGVFVDPLLQAHFFTCAAIGCAGGSIL